MDEEDEAKSLKSKSEDAIEPEAEEKLYVEEVNEEERPYFDAS